MRQELRKQVLGVCQDFFGQEVDLELSLAPDGMGDYATSVAMKLSGKLKKNPMDVAAELAGEIDHKLSNIKKIEVVNPGFINITLNDSVVFDNAITAHKDLNTPLKGQSVVAEYSDPNAFKVLHAGHLYTSLVGDAIANILKVGGANVHRVNFGGDVGRHVAMSMYSILQELGGEHPEKLNNIPKAQQLDWLSDHYVRGNRAFSSDDQAKDQIQGINQRIYDIHKSNDQQSPLAQIYWKTRQWSYDGFDELYKRLGMEPFEKYYPESAVSDLGLKTVKQHLGSVYTESDGAIVFKGEDFGFFTQVFVNSDGLPTYAGKDVGLIQAKFQDFHYDKSLIITDISQKDHLAVVMKSIEQFEPELANRTLHYTHGRIKFSDGRKMSSREGNVITASEVLDATFAEATDKDDQVVLGAIRYAFLKNKIGSDISYDPKTSVSLEGNSGPYIQYALVRAKSILAKVQKEEHCDAQDLEPDERALALSISRFPDVFDEAITSYSPHHICSYLYELAQEFNRFYEKNRVIGDARSTPRTILVQAYERVLRTGLGILGMPTPERM